MLGATPENDKNREEERNDDLSDQEFSVLIFELIAAAHLPISIVELGQLVATPGSLRALEDAGVSPSALLRRHITGDWGELDKEDWEANNRALLEGTRLLSAYTLPKTNERIWIITEWDRSVTTLLLPSEY